MYVPDDTSPPPFQPVVCELFYVLQEWARSATFLWMFLEGYYLHSTLTRDVFNEKPNFV